MSTKFRIINTPETETPFIVFEKNKFAYCDPKSSATKKIWKCPAGANRCNGRLETNGGLFEHNKGQIVDLEECNDFITHTTWSEMTVDRNELTVMMIERIQIATGHVNTHRVYDDVTRDYPSLAIASTGPRDQSKTLKRYNKSKEFELPKTKYNIYETIENSAILKKNYYGAQLARQKKVITEQKDVSEDKKNEWKQMDINSLKPLRNKIQKEIRIKNAELAVIDAIEKVQHLNYNNLSGDFYLGCDDDATFHVFCDPSAADILSKSEWLLVDGTFSITPFILDNVIPLYALPPRPIPRLPGISTTGS